MNIPLNIDFLQVLLHMLNFVILAGGLTFLLFKPVNRFLEQRKAQIEEQERKSRESQEEAERLCKEYELKMQSAEAEVQRRQHEAEREWSEISAQHINEAKEKAIAIIHAAEEEAEERKEHILESAQTEIGEMVLTATQKLLSDTVTPARNSALYDEFVRLAGDKAAGERGKHDQK